VRARTLLLIFALVVSGMAGGAQDGANERVIELTGGGRVVVHADGTMGHYDAAGGPIAMPEGTVMTAKDGGRIMMKAEALWREIVLQATVNYGLASTLPEGGDRASQRFVELRDGGRITLLGDGTMVHYDATGKRVRMAEGAVMIAKDGTRILMNNGTLWSPQVGPGRESTKTKR